MLWLTSKIHPIGLCFEHLIPCGWNYFWEVLVNLGGGASLEKVSTWCYPYPWLFFTFSASWSTMMWTDPFCCALPTAVTELSQSMNLIKLPCLQVSMYVRNMTTAAAIMQTTHGSWCVGKYMSLNSPCRKLPEIGAGKQSCVLCKSSTHS